MWVCSSALVLLGTGTARGVARGGFVVGTASLKGSSSQVLTCVVTTLGGGGGPPGPPARVCSICIIWVAVAVSVWVAWVRASMAVDRSVEVDSERALLMAVFSYAIWFPFHIRGFPTENCHVQ